MAFFPTRARSIPRTPRGSLPVIAIGRRVFVNCQPRDRSEAVFLADESGKEISAVSVTDGLEVEVIAWRPRGAIETRYRVRVPSTGAEGWLPAENLRKVLVPLPAPTPPVPQATSTAHGSRRQFERRSQPVDPSRSASLTPARAVPIAGGGRRFGQHFDAAAEPTAPSSSPASGNPAPTIDDRRRRFGQHF